MKLPRLSKLFTLSFSEVWFLLQAAAAVVAFDLAFRLFSSKTCLALFERKAGSYRKQQGINLQRLAWLAEVADRYAPGRSTCLRKAAALAWLLRRRGIATDLRIGVAHEGGNFIAHSWVESESGEVIGLSNTDKYAPLSSAGVRQPLQTGSER